MFKLNIGGVPEHFNYPWLKCIEDELFIKSKIDVIWHDYHGGTGEMADDLNHGKIDLAVMLTEGSIKEIESGKPFTILQKYVDTPLLWGIHSNPKATSDSLNESDSKNIAISRYNSGSHLMSYVLAEQKSWDTDDLNFKVCGNLDGAIKAIRSNEADIFLWERFTTKPYVDKGLLKHEGNCPTPWPCFVIVTKTEFFSQHEEEINLVLNVLNNFTVSIKDNKHLPEILSEKYDLKLCDTKTWLSQTEWSQEPLKDEMVNLLKAKLKKFNILE
jgi:ABC-type nitrate/sulfonate/bicarbonate transport system substrate-binding protein